MVRGVSKKVEPLTTKDLKKEKATDEKTPADQEEETSEAVDTKKVKRMEDLPGLGPKTAQKLRDLGYKGLVALATARADAISAEMGMSVSYVKAVAWIKAAQEAILSVMNPVTGKELAKQRKLKRVFYKTFSDEFNRIMGGGFATMRTTGLAGRFSTGKTQAIYDGIVATLDENNNEYAFCPMCGHLHNKPVKVCTSCGKDMKRKAAYIETEPDTYSDERIEQIARLQKINIDLDDLWVFPCENIPTAKAQYLQYKILQQLITQKDQNIGFVGVDSMTAKFRPGYSRTEMLPVRTREFTEHFLLIDFLAAKYNIAWVLSCQVIGGVRPGAVKAIIMKTGDKQGYYPVGGDYLLHSVSTWVALSQIKTDTYEAVVFDSNYLQRERIEFMLSSKGLADGVR